MNQEEYRSRARALRQRLESHRLAGWDPPLSRSRSTVVPVDARLASPPEKSSPERPPPASREPPSLEALKAEVAACTRCGLCEGRNRTVFGVGDLTARLMFVGEAPGFDEDQQGEPFVGQAGQLLNRIISAMGLAREAVYIANVVKCRPPENRAPTAAEVEACRDYLEKQIDAVAPEIIVALGASAARFLLGGDLSVGRMRARFHSYRGIAVMPTYHPAYLLREPSQKRKVWEDMQQVMGRLGLGG